jgi:MscS family membrane protein
VHRLILVVVCAIGLLAAQAPPAAKTDPLGRENPRSAVTAFLEACQEKNYQRAAQYMDLRHLSEQNRAQRGPELARSLEAILNSDPDFAIFRLSRNPDGDPANDPEPNSQHLTTIKRDAKSYTLDLERVTLPGNSTPVWLFAPDTVLDIPYLTPSGAPPAIAKYLPPLLVSVNLIETPLWKWLALLLAALLILSLSRLLDRLLKTAIRITARRFRKEIGPPVTVLIIAPLRVIVSLAIFRAVLQFVDPSAIARLYIGRTIGLLLVWVIAWLLIKLAGLFVVHLETVLDARGQPASRSMLYLGRRVANVTIVVLAILTVLSNWGYNTNTLIAGLGVGGIAVALAAQQTIANVFGGVSVIGDQPVRIGDLGKFGDLIGQVEDIGMRSTRIRTLARTVVSVPNSNFAALNIENYTLRDKMLFNTTLPIKRSTPDEQIHQAIDAVRQSLASHKSVEAGEMSVRLTGLASASFNLEIFCYILTSDLKEFYRIQTELLLAMNQVLNNTKVELA